MKLHGGIQSCQEMGQEGTRALKGLGVPEPGGQRQRLRESGWECGTLSDGQSVDDWGCGLRNGGRSEGCGYQSEDDWVCVHQNGELNVVLNEIQSRDHLCRPFQVAVQTQSEES